MKTNNTSGFLCEQPDLHPVSPNFALCAVGLLKAGKVSVKTICTSFERLLRLVSDRVHPYSPIALAFLLYTSVYSKKQGNSAVQNMSRINKDNPKSSMEFVGMTYEGAINNALDKEVAAELDDTLAHKDESSLPMMNAST